MQITYPLRHNEYVFARVLIIIYYLLIIIMLEDDVCYPCSVHTFSTYIFSNLTGLYSSSLGHLSYLISAGIDIKLAQEMNYSSVFFFFFCSNVSSRVRPLSGEYIWRFISFFRKMSDRDISVGLVWEFQVELSKQFHSDKGHVSTNKFQKLDLS